jgi:hypothetical protein
VIEPCEISAFLLKDLFFVIFEENEGLQEG